MREIKFRLPHYNIDGEFVKFTYWGYLDNDTTFYGPSSVQIAPIKKQDEQYTGLKDKNGKEIYEGDICRYGEMIYQVVFNGGSFEFDCLYPFGVQSSCEIIGNIHENQELLK